MIEFKPVNTFSFAEEVRKQTKKSVDAYEIREIDEGSNFYNEIIKERVLVG